MGTITLTSIQLERAIFLVTTNAVTLVKADNTVWTSAVGTASSFNVYISASVLTLENKFGSTQAFQYMVFKSG